MLAASYATERGLTLTTLVADFRRFPVDTPERRHFGSETSPKALSGQTPLNRDIGTTLAPRKQLPNALLYSGRPRKVTPRFVQRVVLSCCRSGVFFGKGSRVGWRRSAVSLSRLGSARRHAVGGSIRSPHHVSSTSVCSSRACSLRQPETPPNCSSSAGPHDDNDRSPSAFDCFSQSTSVPCTPPDRGSPCFPRRPLEPSSATGGSPRRSCHRSNSTSTSATRPCQHARIHTKYCDQPLGSSTLTAQCRGVHVTDRVQEAR